MKKSFYTILLICLMLFLSACTDTEPDTGSVFNMSGNSGMTITEEPGGTSLYPTEVPDGPTLVLDDKINTPVQTAEPTPDIPWDGAYIEKETYIASKVKNFVYIYMGIEPQLTIDELEKAKKVYDDSIECIKNSRTVAETDAAYCNAINRIMDIVPKADGLYSFEDVSYTEKTEILAILERYALAKGITGITLYENGSYMMYNPRVILGIDKYVPGYGYGVLEEGTIRYDLKNEKNSNWRRYYHTYIPEDSGSVNALDCENWDEIDPKNSLELKEQGLYGYISAPLFEKFLKNSDTDEYEWRPVLAKALPQPINDENGDGKCTTWRIEVKTGADGLKYRSGSKLSDRKAFDGREVELKDYEYAFKLLLTQSNGLKAGKSLAERENDCAIAGVKEFYDASAAGFKKKLWDKVGIRTYEEDGKSFLEIEYLEEQNRFFAMYNISSVLFAPVPEEFIDLVKLENYLRSSDDESTDWIDNSLSLGPYYPERYDAGKQIVLQKNPYYALSGEKYRILGIHIKVLNDSKTDNNFAINEFLNERLDGCLVPVDYAKDYLGDSRMHQIGGSVNYKLNVNLCDDKTLDSLFGETGTERRIKKAGEVQNDSDAFWKTKPVLSNEYFRKAISLSINRLELSLETASYASNDYLPSEYIIDPDNSIAYNSSDIHKFVKNDYFEGADDYGYSMELSKENFKLAITELESKGILKPGTKDNPSEIELEIAWMVPSDEEEHHNMLKEYIEKAFNDPSVCNGAYHLKISFWAGNEWSDVYYHKMMIGQYDLGIGSVTGNELNPIGLFGTMSTDREISDNLTLCWGVDTNDADDYPIVYKGLRWSFDALYTALRQQALVDEGKNKKPVSIEYRLLSQNEDGSFEGSFLIRKEDNISKGLEMVDFTDRTEIDTDISVVPLKILCCNYDRFYNGDGKYVDKELDLKVAEDLGDSLLVSFVVPKEIVDEFTAEELSGVKEEVYIGIDLIYNYRFNGVSKDTFFSVNDSIASVTPDIE